MREKGQPVPDKCDLCGQLFSFIHTRVTDKDGDHCLACPELEKKVGDKPLEVEEG